jgi:hypothetical protein
MNISRAAANPLAGEAWRRETNRRGRRLDAREDARAPRFLLHGSGLMHLLWKVRMFSTEQDGFYKKLCLILLLGVHE